MHNIDTELLRKQRDWLLSLPECDEANGLINLCDSILDEIEVEDQLTLSDRERRWAASIVQALEQGRITPDSVKRLPPYWYEVLMTYDEIEVEDRPS